MSVAKSNGLIYKNGIQEWVGLICLLGMVLGFVASRGILSVSMIVLFLNAFWPLQFKEVWTRFRQSKFHLLALLYFLLNFIGGIWSDKQDVWLDVLVLHLPFLVLPLGMMTIPMHLHIFRKRFLVALYAIILGVIGVSLTLFFANYNMYVEGYVHSKQIPTIRFDDHIRFSLFLALSIIPGIAYLREEAKEDRHKTFSVFIYATIGIVIIYLHILSAKSGLLALYIILGFLLFLKLRTYKYKFYAIILPPIAIVLLGIFAYKYIATFQTKIDYVIYEFGMIFSDKPLNYNYSSAGRLISYQVAVEQIKEAPIFGVGNGDVMQQMRLGYERQYPAIPVENHLIPHSQFLYTLMAFGLVFLPIFLFLVCSPFFSKLGKAQIYLTINTVVLLVAFSFEAMLQVQLGMFVYLYFTLIWYRWQLSPPL